MIRIASALVLCAALAACSTGQGQTGPSVDMAQVISTAETVCREGMPLIQIAAAPGWPDPVRSIGTALNAFCAPLASGSVPATLDANSVNWLQQNLASLAALVGKY